MHKDENFEEILGKLRRYCAYRERCTKEVRDKMKKWILGPGDQNELLARLRDESFLDDARFAESYARSKNRQNKWGKYRIAMELRSRNIDEQMVQAALEGIEEEQYREQLKELILKKRDELGKPIDFEKKQKLLRYVTGKGYSSGEVFGMLEEMKIEG